MSPLCDGQIWKNMANISKAREEAFVRLRWEMLAVWTDGRMARQDIRLRIRVKTKTWAEM